MDNSTIASSEGTEETQPQPQQQQPARGTGGGEEQTPQLFCLRWNNYQSNLTNVFDQLLQNESFVDVTLACADGHTVKAHKMVLSACSPYFQSLFFENPCKHPIVILKDIKWTELKAAVEFMYKGEINVCQEQIAPLLKVAESLKIRGLADVSNEHDFAATRDSKSPTATGSSSANAETISARSPSRISSVSGGQPPTKKRRRTSADRSSTSTGEDTISVINSPSRALELVTSPSSSSVGTTSVCSTNNNMNSAGNTSGSHQQHQQQQSQSQAGRPSQSSTPQSPSNNVQPLPLPPPPPSLPSTSSVADDMEIKPGIAEMIREEERTNKVRQLWQKPAMVAAIKSILSMKMGVLKASKTFNVPRTTLRGFVSRARSIGMSAEGSSNAEFDRLVDVRMGRKTILSRKLEERLVEHCVEIDDRYFGVERRDIRRMACDLAVKHNLKHHFKTEGAGRKWLQLFMVRHPQLARCFSEAKLKARKLGFTQQNVNKFYELLQPELAKVEYADSRVFTVDEFGISFCKIKGSSKKMNVGVVKQRPEVVKLSAVEKDTLVMAIVSASANGTFIPPTIILPKKCKNEISNYVLPEGSVVEYLKSDWITKEIFAKWFTHFIKTTKSSKSNPSVLIFNGRNPYCRNLEIIDKAAANAVSLVCLPPSCNLWLQPLEVSFIEPFKIRCANEMEKWLREPQNQNKKVTQLESCSFFTPAYNEVATVVNVKIGFENTGILPFDKNKFTEADFCEGEETAGPYTVADSSSAENSCESDQSGDEIEMIETTIITKSTEDVPEAETTMLTATFTEDAPQAETTIPTTSTENAPRPETTEQSVTEIPSSSKQVSASPISQTTVPAQRTSMTLRTVRKKKVFDW